MSIYKYNDEIEFNLPYGYEHVTEEFDEVGLCECIIYGPEESVYGDTFYDFLLPVVEVSISEDFPQFRGFSSNEILHNLGNENGMKYIVTNAANPIKLALRGQLLAATIQYASIKLWIPVSSDKLLCLSEGAIQKRDEEVKIYLPDKIAHILKVAKGISINGKPLDVSGLNANKLAEVLEPSFDDAECEDVTAKLYGKNTKTAAIKKKETHMATGKNRRINVEDCWTIEIPKDWVEDNDSDEDKLLCVKSNREDDFSKEQGYTQRLTISSTCGNVNLYGDDLTTPAAKREIKSALSAWESNRKECLPILEMMDDVMGEIKEAKHTKDVAVYYAHSSEVRTSFHAVIFVFLRRKNMFFVGDFNFDNTKREAAKWKKQIVSMLQTVEAEAVANEPWYLLSKDCCVGSADKRVEFARGIEIGVPKGFHFSTDMDINGGRKLSIVPKSYDFSKNPMEASIALTVRTEELNYDYKKKDLPAVMEIFPTRISSFFEEDKMITTLACNDKGALLYQEQYFYEEDNDEYINKIHALLFANGKGYLIFFIVNKIGCEVESWKLRSDFLKLAENWLGSIRVKSWPETSTPTEPQLEEIDSEESPISAQIMTSTDSINFTEANPEEHLYPHYKRLKDLVENPLPGTISVVNTQGTEYQMIPLRKMISPDDEWEDDEASDKQAAAERRAIYESILAKDTQAYYLEHKAEEMRLLFHVNDEVFDSRHDRESELAEGLMHRAYMMSALRSFAWTLADYCKQNELQPREISYEILQQIIVFIASKKWLNYEADSYCKGLCGGQDLHVYYVPEGISDEEKKVLYPGKEKLEYHENLKKLQASWGGSGNGTVLSDVASLEMLREDLNYIYPAVKVLYKELAKKRSFDEPLIGDAADILYAWCALAYAAKEPFFTEDGPMRCSFSRTKH